MFTVETGIISVKPRTLRIHVTLSAHTDCLDKIVKEQCRFVFCCGAYITPSRFRVKRLIIFFSADPAACAVVPCQWRRIIGSYSSDKHKYKNFSFAHFSNSTIKYAAIRVINARFRAKLFTLRPVGVNHFLRVSVHPGHFHNQPNHKAVINAQR